MVDEFRSGADGTADEFAAAVGADEVQLGGGAIEAVGALERADVGFARIGREIAIAAFAVGAEFEGHGFFEPRRDTNEHEEERG